MKITDVKIRHIFKESDSTLRAVASVTFDGEFAVHDLKVVQTKKRMFVTMPSRKDSEGTYRNIAHPINTETRQKLEDAVLAAYRDAVKQAVTKKGA